MLILRTRNFSAPLYIGVGKVIDKVTQKLDQERIEDYEVVHSITPGAINIFPNLDKVRIYVPEELEYTQFDIESFIRRNCGMVRVETCIDRDILRMEIKGKITEAQLVKLIKYIINETDSNFVYLISDEEED